MGVIESITIEQGRVVKKIRNETESAVVNYTETESEISEIIKEALEQKQGEKNNRSGLPTIINQTEIENDDVLTPYQRQMANKTQNGQLVINQPETGNEIGIRLTEAIEPKHGSKNKRDRPQQPDQFEENNEDQIQSKSGTEEQPKKKAKQVSDVPFVLQRRGRLKCRQIKIYADPSDYQEYLEYLVFVEKNSRKGSFQRQELEAKIFEKGIALVIKHDSLFREYQKKK
jgi:hypothetical protein